MYAEFAGEGSHADAERAGCSHSVHFLVGEPCSRSFLWFRRRADQRVVGLAVGLCIGADALIPRGNQPLNPWSPVPAVLHCVHSIPAAPAARFVPGCERGRNRSAHRGTMAAPRHECGRLAPRRTPKSVAGAPLRRPSSLPQRPSISAERVNAPQPLRTYRSAGIAIGGRVGRPPASRLLPELRRG